MPSSPLHGLVDQLAELEDVPPVQQVLSAMGSVSGPRHRRGIHHPITGLLVIAVCAVASGARSFAAIAK